MTTAAPPSPTSPFTPSPFTVSPFAGRSAAPDPVALAVESARDGLDQASRTLASARIDAWAGYAADAYRQRVDRIDALLAQAERLVGVARCDADRLAGLVVAAADEQRRTFAELTA